MQVGHDVHVDQSADSCRRELLEPAERWLPAPVSSSAAGDGRFLVWLGFGGPEISVTKEVELTVGRPEVEEDRLVVPIGWRATGPGQLFPVFDGQLTVRPLGPHSCRLSLGGGYEPPLGALGRRLDEAMLHRAAEATLRHLAAGIAARVSELAASRPA